ncbi:hypothetical protein pkur_cds_16 [Pandoravirus kuranda]|uniref:Uncharacterized protein n=1 Tax=Pandoravirus kuranda TaxID=3019033 RepID=A0AA95J756_9VIRU|nr:hypothetical protein pkur_cds_16 [Pandoravirus kuranda]
MKAAFGMAEYTVEVSSGAAGGRPVFVTVKDISRDATVGLMQKRIAAVYARRYRSRPALCFAADAASSYDLVDSRGNVLARSSKVSEALVHHDPCAPLLAVQRRAPDRECPPTSRHAEPSPEAESVGPQSPALGPCATVPAQQLRRSVDGQWVSVSDIVRAMSGRWRGAATNAFVDRVMHVIKRRVSFPSLFLAVPQHYPGTKRAARTPVVSVRQLSALVDAVGAVLGGDQSTDAAMRFKKTASFADLIRGHVDDQVPLSAEATLLDAIGIDATDEASGSTVPTEMRGHGSRGDGSCASERSSESGDVVQRRTAPVDSIGNKRTAGSDTECWDDDTPEVDVPEVPQQLLGACRSERASGHKRKRRRAQTTGVRWGNEHDWIHTTPSIGLAPQRVAESDVDAVDRASRCVRWQGAARAQPTTYEDDDSDDDSDGSNGEKEEEDDTAQRQRKRHCDRGSDQEIAPVDAADSGRDQQRGTPSDLVHDAPAHAIAAVTDEDAHNGRTEGKDKHDKGEDEETQFERHWNRHVAANAVAKARAAGPLRIWKTAGSVYRLMLSISPSKEMPGLWEVVGGRTDPHRSPPGPGEEWIDDAAVIPIVARMIRSPSTVVTTDAAMSPKSHEAVTVAHAGFFALCRRHLASRGGNNSDANTRPDPSLAPRARRLARDAANTPRAAVCAQLARLLA